MVEQLEIPQFLRALWYEVGRSHASGATPFGQQDAAVGLARRTISLDLLDSSHIRRLITGRQLLHEAAVSALGHLSEDIACQKPAPLHGHGCADCLALADTLWTDALRGNKRLDALRDPLGLFARIATDMRWEDLLRSSRSQDTSACAHDWFGKKLADTGEKIWASLPTMFEFRLE